MENRLYRRENGNGAEQVLKQDHQLVLEQVLPDNEFEANRGEYEQLFIEAVYESDSSKRTQLLVNELVHLGYDGPIVPWSGVKREYAAEQDHILELEQAVLFAMHQSDLLIKAIPKEYNDVLHERNYAIPKSTAIVVNRLLTQWFNSSPSNFRTGNSIVRLVTNRIEQNLHENLSPTSGINDFFHSIGVSNPYISQEEYQELQRSFLIGERIQLLTKDRRTVISDDLLTLRNEVDFSDGNGHDSSNLLNSIGLDSLNRVPPSSCPVRVREFNAMAKTMGLLAETAYLYVISTEMHSRVYFSTDELALPTFRTITGTEPGV